LKKKEPTKISPGEKESIQGCRLKGHTLEPAEAEPQTGIQFNALLAMNIARNAENIVCLFLFAKKFLKI
jgi:hypothetical protein